MDSLNFPIVDPHIHQWDPLNTPHAAAFLVKVFGRYPTLMDKMVRLLKPKPVIEFLGLTDYGLAPYLPADFKKDCGPYTVESAVHIEAGWHEHEGLGVVNETKWVNQLPFAEQGIKLSTIVGTADPRSKQFPDILAAHQASSPQFSGIRKMASFHDDKGIYRWADQPALYTDKKFLTGFEHLAKTSLTFDAWTYSTQINEVSTLAKAFPETPIVIDHLATPAGLFGPVGRRTGKTENERAGIFSRWKDDIAHLAECPNVHAKISGLMMPVLGHSFHKTRQLATADNMVTLLSPMVDHAMNVFGHERIIYASNFPMDKVSARLTDIIEAYIKMINPYGDVALESVFRGNAKKFYRI